MTSRVRLRSSLSLVLCLSLARSLARSLSLSLSLSLFLSLSQYFFFFYRECILSETIKTAPGSSVFADSCGATQLKEVLVSSAPRGRSLALAGGDTILSTRKLQPKPAPGLHLHPHPIAPTPAHRRPSSRPSTDRKGAPPRAA